MKERRPFWYEFHEWFCVLCMDGEIERRRVYDRPKPLLWEDRHHFTEYACGAHF